MKKVEFNSPAIDDMSRIYMGFTHTGMGLELWDYAILTERAWNELTKVGR